MDVLRLVADGAFALLGAAILLRWTALGVLSAVDWLRRQGEGPPTEPPGGWPRVAVIIPAFNEEAVVAGAVRSALSGDYPDLEVVIVDDGSSDRTGEIAADLAEDPRVSAITMHPNQGKPAALDAGIRAASSDLVVTVDADTVLARDAVRHLVRPLLDDPGLAAVAGPGAPKDASVSVVSPEVSSGSQASHSGDTARVLPPVASLLAKRRAAERAALPAAKKPKPESG